MKLKQIAIRIAIFAVFTITACNFSTAISPNETTPTPLPLATQGAVAGGLPEPTEAGAPTEPCYFGIWELTNLGAVVLGAIPTETIEEYDLQLEEGRGSAQLTLRSDGVAELRFNQVEIDFSAKVSIVRVPLTVEINGTSTGSYQATADTLTTEGMSTNGLTASAKAAGQDLIEPDQILTSLPLVSPSFNTASMVCASNRLQLQIYGYPASVPALDFNRIQ